MRNIIMLIITGLIVLGVILFFTLSEKKPVEELNKAEQAIQTAKEAEALKWAPDCFKAALEKLETGKNLIEKRKYKEAKEVLIDCANFAINCAIEAKNNKQKVIEEENKKIENDKIAKQSSIRKHNVIKGDCLWFISTDYYNDPYQWPKLFNANRDIISNPDLIYPGQLVTIP